MLFVTREVFHIVLVSKTGASFTVDYIIETYDITLKHDLSLGLRSTAHKIFIS
jgi:hypothetical protein